MPRLLTGRYSDFDTAAGVPVGVTVGRPKFPLPYAIAAEANELKPFGLMGQPLSPADFDDAFRARLNRTGVNRIQQRLDTIAAEHGEPLVLLCFENVHAGQHCHRRTFATWWEDRTGQAVPELGPAQQTLDLGAS